MLVHSYDCHDYTQKAKPNVLITSFSCHRILYSSYPSNQTLPKISPIPSLQNWCFWLIVLLYCFHMNCLYGRGMNCPIDGYEFWRGKGMPTKCLIKVPSELFSVGKGCLLPIRREQLSVMYETRRQRESGGELHILCTVCVHIN